MRVVQRNALIATAKLMLSPLAYSDLYEAVTVALDWRDAPPDLEFCEIVIDAAWALRKRDATLLCSDAATGAAR